MVIVPDEAGLEVEARIENKDVGFVQIGRPVEVEVNALSANVSAAPGQASLSVYIARVALDTRVAQ